MEKIRALLTIHSILFTLLASSLACQRGGDSSREEREPAGSMGDQLELSECRLPVQRIYQDDAFVTVVSFKVGVDYSPTQLEVISNHAQIPEAGFQRCISKWRFHSLSVGAKVFVAFRWEGAAGWRHVRFSSSSEGFSKEISFEGEPSE